MRQGRESRSERNEDRKERLDGATFSVRSAPVPVSRSPSSGPLVEEAAADSESNDEKRKARYKANSPDVQAYYRVNRYPAK